MLSFHMSYLSKLMLAVFQKVSAGHKAIKSSLWDNIIIISCLIFYIFLFGFKISKIIKPVCLLFFHPEVLRNDSEFSIFLFKMILMGGPYLPSLHLKYLFNKHLC